MPRVLKIGNRELKREIDLNGVPHVVIITAEGIYVRKKRSWTTEFMTWQNLFAIIENRKKDKQ